MFFLQKATPPIPHGETVLGEFRGCPFGVAWRVLGEFVGRGSWGTVEILEGGLGFKGQQTSLAPTNEFNDTLNGARQILLWFGITNQFEQVC